MPERDCVGLNLRGSVRDLDALGIELVPGMKLNVWDADADDAGERDDLIGSGTVERWGDIWVLRLDWLRNQSDPDSYSMIK